MGGPLHGGQAKGHGDARTLYQHEWKREDSEISNTSSTQHKAESEIHKHKLTTTTTTTTTTMKSSLAAILALGLCLSQGTLTKADGSANFLRDVGADTALLFGNHDLSDQILGSENNRRKLHGIGDAAPIAVHLPFHKPDDFLGEFQTAAGEILPHPEANAAPSDTNYLDSVIEEERNSGRKLLAGITQLFNHAVRRFGEKAVENGVPAGVRVGANLAHIPTTPVGNRRNLQAGITQLFNHAVRRFGEKAVENGVPAGVRVGA